MFLGLILIAKCIDPVRIAEAGDGVIAVLGLAVLCDIFMTIIKIIKMEK